MDFTAGSGPLATRDSAWLSERALQLPRCLACVDNPESGNELIPTLALWQSLTIKVRGRGSGRDTPATSQHGATRGGLREPSNDTMGSWIWMRHETRPSTFPGDSLKWVPRKRHNSRWPIEPKKEEATHMVADLQPLIKFEVPTSPEPLDTTLRMDEEQMRRRSPRRLSRRISLIPGEGSPRKLPMVTLSPAEISAPVLSPVKRPPVTLSPTKVADSPLRSFRVNATPTKVVLESPKTKPPAQSPAKPSSLPITPIEDARLTPVLKAAEHQSPVHPPATPVPLLFEQPTPDAQAEPQHEARRRVSLQSARRSERGSNGASRLLALKSGRNSPNRRHSFTSLENLTADVRGGAKNRRNTMDVFCVGPEETRGVAGEGEVVEVDMKTSLDIFSQPTKALEPASRRRSDGGPEESEAQPAIESESLSLSPAASVSSANLGLATSDVILNSASSIVTEGAGVETEPEDASPRQAATSPIADRTDSDGFSLELTPHAAEEPTQFSDGEESEAMFFPHDPEGLSTIYEESSIFESQSPEEAGVKQTAQEHPSNDVELKTDIVESALEAARIAPDERLMTETVPGSHVSACHVANSADAMSSLDSLHHNREAQQTLVVTKDEDAGPMNNSEDSPVAPPAHDEFDGTAAPAVPQGSKSPSRVVTAAHTVPGTPTTLTATGSMQRVVTPEPGVGALATEQESSGFTPINGRQISPPHVPPPGLRADEEEEEAGNESDDLDADEVIEEDFPEDAGDEATMAMDEDMLAVDAPRPENDTLQLHARHDDSETEMLRNFVTRVTADKNAKAAAAAAALAKKVARRSGSIGSITSSTGSPMAKPGTQTPTSRTPLGVKSPNSPSPAKKKRKLELFEGDVAKDNEEASAQPSDGPRLKRRRKRTDPAPETPLEKSASPSPEPDSSAPGPRRSARARSTRVALRPSAPSANSIALSMIPVRLPGMGAMDEAAMDAHLAAMARQRSEEKDLAAVTRGNTRKNKGSAVLPQMVLAKQAEDPSWRMRELKGVFDAKERRAKEPAAAAGGDEERDGKKSRQVKGVRWAEELVRFQTEAEPSVFRGMSSQLLADVMMDDGVDEIAEAEPPVPAEPRVEKTARVAARKAVSTATSAPTAAAPPASTRRTRSSRLPPPTPAKKLRGGAEKTAGEQVAAPPAPAPAPAPALRTRTKSMPKLAPAPPTTPSPVLEPSPAPVPAATAKSTRSGMATRRTRIAKLGMSGNGTPAPKRRGRTAA
ncbi:hypothetical protein C8A00DRAFT_44607 [Chaetomidium leptoderma]|uniref:Uncharacterized protein n=1 Tax=Chaetomidium leptoderma TaxID=669021 RepID=A0AAN6ZVZ2_9PEZI|nr:hypothetical protein C8A00DRAFT_44607 [Chaetomidium leptoderma]